VGLNVIRVGAGAGAELSVGVELSVRTLIDSKPKWPRTDAGC